MGLTKEMEEKPYHYGSHYSNVGSVLHYLVRLEPFSQYFLDFQGGRFDVPDRAFHSIKQTWLLSTKLSSSDVKELIPEFFCLPEFLANSNRFDMGIKQSGERVDDVILPAWAKSNPRTFIRKHREALECNYVSQNLHHWIDLIFGYKQTGDAAVEAVNVFYPLTYEGAVDVDAITDDVLREATIAQISSYGQTPKQLFTKPHPAKSVMLAIPPILRSPERLMATPMWSLGISIEFLTIVNGTPLALGGQKHVVYPDCSRVLSWNHWDQSLRICSIDTGKVLCTIRTYNDDDVTCAAMPKTGRIL